MVALICIGLAFGVIILIGLAIGIAEALSYRSYRGSVRRAAAHEAYARARIDRIYDDATEQVSRFIG